MKENTENKHPHNCKYPGTAVDTADGEKVTQAEVDERTEVLDSNPRIDPTDIEEIPS
ncbi:MAG: hypothetical protein K2F99_08205 [Muribaculaceae bacterium]|nr:hypothetical protein [Muribaculaceae bacterium]